MGWEGDPGRSEGAYSLLIAGRTGNSAISPLTPVRSNLLPSEGKSVPMLPNSILGYMHAMGGSPLHGIRLGTTQDSLS